MGTPYPLWPSAASTRPGDRLMRGGALDLRERRFIMVAENLDVFYIHNSFLLSALGMYARSQSRFFVVVFQNKNGPRRCAWSRLRCSRST